MRIAALVLAAGRSARAGTIKALALHEGETFLARTIDTLRGAGVPEVLVVIAEPHGAAIARALPEGAGFVRNPAPERGMLGSLRVGLAALAPVGAAPIDSAPVDRVVVSLIDHPRVRASTVRALLAALDGGAMVARPRCVDAHGRARRGHPYAIAGAAIGALRAAPLDRRARDVLRELVPATDVDVDDPGVLDDFDRPLSHWSSAR